MHYSPLKEYRRQHGLSQQDVAERLEISRQMISHLERGDREYTAELAVKIERVLGIPKFKLRGDIFERAA